ncbi:MGDG synthase family glycosyltransferase [Labrys monachus]|uniref:Processive 1,2-diacylglycerol beta-glucosyltransferase n=1 Tax=Labrys monachus TaxID=217067 RepID=A0ABU0FQN0_9HYPH|nr:glycosyltransferase [Labrys monachus]MDQ0396375.1 processive 1,2-diacylglycerol beta-glucosyltransferase [Labrys monachus]
MSVSSGAGHMRAAEALAEAARTLDPSAETLHIDVMSHVSTTFRKVYTDYYIKLVTKHPALWGMLYQASSETPPDAVSQKLRRAIERLSTRSLAAAIGDFAPDAIVCTHFLPAELMMREISKGRLGVPVWIQITDFDLHRMWVIPRMTGFFAGNEEVAFRLRAHGIDPARIHVTGIPIMPAFAETLDRAACAEALGLDPGRRIYLLMGGGAGLGVVPLARRLCALDPDVQLVVLAGRNRQALDELQALASQQHGRLLALGFTDEVPRLLAAADLVITKPGGLSTSECLAMGAPMLLSAPIPGQEERNADYLLENGAAMKAIDPVGLEYRIALLKAEPQRLVAMRRNARALGRPQAAADAMRIVLADLA